jgi:hypothetical protein
VNGSFTGQTFPGPHKAHPVRLGSREMIHTCSPESLTLLVLARQTLRLG